MRLTTSNHQATFVRFIYLAQGFRWHYHFIFIGYFDIPGAGGLVYQGQGNVTTLHFEVGLDIHFEAGGGWYHCT